MGLPIISIAAFVLLLTLVIYQYVIFPALLSPLSRIPNAHWSAPFSRLWILFHRSREEETPTVHTAHQRHGPIIRIAPNEISVNSVDGGIRSIYAGGFEKGDWYRNVFNNYGIMPMCVPQPANVANGRYINGSALGLQCQSMLRIPNGNECSRIFMQNLRCRIRYQSMRSARLFSKTA